ncbi:cytochrome P450 [Dongia deserti]|uniref:cytochrome P450 n=1 Tax=Dongia deserti TaxID=2268030 RepID=UPI000E64B6AD|nr:cytochrome P450 [Dongia deserti]
MMRRSSLRSAAGVTTPFDFLGHHFAAGDWLLLDFYGTNHDSRTWSEPDAFRPERFLKRQPGPFDLVPLV